jgi:[CysO sulfur-carrier protein]-S-L-cysteine hydrolase
MNLVITSVLLDQIIEQARRVYPNEACGLLVGRNAADRFIPMKNIAASRDRYEMDPAELIVQLRDLRTTGETLVAIFHSHPHGPAEPSKTDIDRAFYPEAAHLIVSLAEPERPQAVAFRILDGGVLPIELHVIV